MSAPGGCLLGGWVWPRGGLLGGGRSAPEGSALGGSGPGGLLWGVWPGGCGIPACTEVDPPCEQNE